MLDNGIDLNFPAWPQYDDTERDGLVRALEQGQWWRIGGTRWTSSSASSPTTTVPSTRWR